ncbi:MAG TPA: periplasmic heavy metal sensor [Mariniphaga sp.]|nr:periplasmic heavy metal sensor [Mariniphaga sp.]
MMVSQQKYKILIWVVVILALTNLSMGLSFLYHRQQEKQLLADKEEQNIELPAQQRTRFFREQLNLDRQQLEQFRTLNRDFNRTAWNIKHQLSELRILMIDELKQDNPDEQKLNAISSQIGALHKELKDETINYYLGMKEVSNIEQQEKLYEIFMSVLEENEEVQLPQRGRGFRINN